MPRLCDIARGTRATKPVKLPLSGLDDPVDVLVRPLNGLELGAVVARARAYALDEMRKARPNDDSRPLPEPREGDRLFDLGSMAATLLLACLDPEHPERPFFGDMAEILSELDAERIVLLYEEQQLWQDECAPRPRTMNGAAFMALVMGEAALEEEAADGPFAHLPRTLQRISFRILAKQHVSSLLAKSASSSADGTATSI
jgi:hypothetical protein